MRHASSGRRDRLQVSRAGVSTARFWAAYLAVAFIAIVLLGSGCDTRRSADDPTTPSTIPVRFERVVDGDTIIVHLPNGARERVRYTGLDTPELARDGRPAEPFAEEAADTNRRFLEGAKVGLEMDVQERDEHGRLLAYVWAGDLLVNRELIRLGLAKVWTHPPNVRHVESYTAAQAEARAAKRGIWGD